VDIPVRSAKNRRKFWSEQVPMSFTDKPIGYEEKRKFRYSLQDYMHEFFKFNELAGKLVLDAGSGAGIDSAEIIQYGANVISLDFSPLACNSTRNLLQEARLEGSVVNAEISHLPFEGQQFDVIYSFGVIHHIPNVQEILGEIKRCLRDDGIFMGMVYNRDSLLYAYSLLYLHGIRDGLFAKGYSEEQVASRFSERMEGNPYTRCYTKSELEELLRSFFEHVNVRTFYNVIDAHHARKVKFELEDSSIELGWHLAFRAVK